MGTKCLRGIRTVAYSLTVPPPTQSSRSRTSIPFSQHAQRRHKSGPYGYTQSKTLIFSKFGEPSDVLNLHTHSISPSIPASSVLLRTLAAPINPADINTVQGTYGLLPQFSTSPLGTPEPSAIPGNEACFEVVSVGSGVKSLKKGDWVIPQLTGFGTWRTHVLVEDADNQLINAVPGGAQDGGLTPVQVATVSVNPCSAYRMLKDYVDLVSLSVQSYSRSSTEGDPPDGGAWFIQNGANSGVGRAAIQLGKLWGLRSINIIRERENDPAATEALKSDLKGLGADIVLTESEFLDRSFKDRLQSTILRGGRDPLMLGLNCVGGKSATSIAKSLSESGTMVTYGAMAKQPVMLPTGLLIFKDLRFKGFWLSRWTKADPEEKRRTVGEILRWIREGKFRDAPVEEVKWDWDTEVGTLKGAVQGTLGGFRNGKGVFVMGDT